MKRLCPFLLIFSLIFSFSLLNGCSPDKSKSNDSTEMQQPDNLAHDPYSAPLQAASRKASATDFKTELINGETFQLSAQQGKVVLLNVWATWCAPCEEETPILVDLYQSYSNKNVEFLGISIDEQGKSVVQPFVDKHDVPYPVTIDTDGAIMEKYGPVMGIPTTYIIDQEGNLRYFATGALTHAEIQPRLEKLLNEANS